MNKSNNFSIVISLIALCVSLIALGFSINKEDNPMVFGTSASSHHMVEVEDQTLYVLSVPMEFHNSSSKNIALKTFQAKEDVVQFDKEINYKLYVSNVHLGSVPQLWIKQLRQEKPLDMSQGIHHIIRPKQSYKAFLVIVIENFEHIKALKGKLSFEALFSNEQIIPVEQSLNLGG